MDIKQEANDILGHFVRRFTIIDFLGYLIPGAIITLALNQRFGHVIQEPLIAFFGHQIVLLSIYFLVLSYLFGTIIHEISQLLGFLADFILSKKLISREREGHTLYYYHKVFQQPEFYGPFRLKSNMFERRQAGKRLRKIQRFLQPELEKTKFPLLRAFSTMGRTGAVTAILLILLYWDSLVWDYSISPYYSLFRIALLVGLAVLLFARCVRFKKIVMHYIYDAFDSCCRAAGII